ncbi:hypothetical protein PINS_up012073 [Pythium insidiosum]|nr:hypothetical protein PINS_up012073 [Pythium insidiosum]
MEFTTYEDDSIGGEDNSQSLPPTISEHGEGGSSDEEEDAWLSLEVARLIEEERRLDASGGVSYKAQLMDEDELRSLRRAIRTRELQVERDGRMHEYVPKKPTTSPLATTGHRRLGRTPRPMISQLDESTKEEAADPFTLRLENIKAARSLGEEIKEIRGVWC